MKMLKSFLLALFGCLAAVLAQDQSGFISIDCGLTESSSYNDVRTGITYSTDAAFIDGGRNSNVSTEFMTSLVMQLWTVRSFPGSEGLRNCYNLSGGGQGKGNKYIIRATFLYGNYDGKNQPPEFDLHLGVELWDTVKLENVSDVVTKEIIHVPSSNYIYVCLVNTGSGTPFVSALELRRLDNSMYPTGSESLANVLRVDFGSTMNQIVRYPNDVYDRIWSPSDISSNWNSSSTSLNIDVRTHNSYRPPPDVMRTVVKPRNATQPLNFYWVPYDPSAQIYAYLHFAEIEVLQGGQTREFNIYRDEIFWYGPFAPDYLHTTTIYDVISESRDTFSYSLTKNQTSDLPPIISAIEFYAVKRFLQPQTDENDVYALVNIKSTYGVKKNWEGDPCSPKAYSWEGLNCSYINGSDPPRIIYLNLSSSGLTGEIAPHISNLLLIRYLDLSNNRLTGQIPESLSRLTFLKYLNLKGNKLSGSVPQELVKRSKNGSLSLSVDETVTQIPDPPQSAPSNKKKKSNKFVVPVVATIASIFVFISVIVICRLKWRKHQVVRAYSLQNKRDEFLESKNRRFTYSEVLEMTNNLRIIVGKGGFGNVYHGCLGNIQVAVKMLSQSSIQGYKQFQAEAELLTKVHHANLTALVGYCYEGTNMGLIYEYMAEGNLKEHLLDSKTNVLSWVKRLEIAVDAAQGLDYLHSGCKPRIIHRDVKCTNILLNEKFGAKLADFGLSKVFPIEDASHVSTTIVGTPGYLDPEYFELSRLTEKSDVYSFGVVLLELITGRPAVPKIEGTTHITHWVNHMHETGDTGNIIDPRLQENFDINYVKKAINIAMCCASLTSLKRPTMSHVVTELKDCLAAEKARLDGLGADSRDSIGVISVTSQDSELYPR